MPNLTGMVDLAALSELFKNPQANSEEIARLGPGFSEFIDVKPEKEQVPPDVLGQLQGGGPATSLSPESLASAEQAPATEEKSGVPWIDLLRLGSVGLTDIGNALGNPRTPVGGAIYEQNKEYFRKNQMDQLQRRHDMFDDAYNQSKALPTEALTDPAFSGLAAAKTALDKDAEDGKIDNEKNVSRFLTEMSRSKKDLEQLQLQTTTANQLAAEQRMEEGRRQRTLAERTQLEAIAGNPESYPPDQVRQAQIRLNQLKAEDYTTRQVGGRDVTLSGGDWTKFDLQEGREASQAKLQADRLAAEERMHRESLGSNERLRQSQQGASRRNQVARSLASQVNNATRQIGGQMKTDQLGNPTNPDAIYERSLKRNTNAILNAAEASGIRIEHKSIPGQGAASVGPDGRPVLGNREIIIWNGQVYDMGDPDKSTELLSSLYQLITSGGSVEE